MRSDGTPRARLKLRPDDHSPAKKSGVSSMVAMGRKAGGFLAAAAVVASSLVIGAGAAQANTSNVPPLPNPAMTDQCSIDLAIQLDYSASMSTGQLTAQEDAVKDLATALQGYPVRLALFNFGSDSPIASGAANAPLPLTSVENQAGVDAIHAKLDAFNRSGTQYTNWQPSMLLARAANPTTRWCS